MPNNKGGKKYKRNKNVIQENKNTRFKDENESQEYAQITKALGNCRFEVLCFDGKNRLGELLYHILLKRKGGEVLVSPHLLEHYSVSSKSKNDKINSESFQDELRICVVNKI